MSDIHFIERALKKNRNLKIITGLSLLILAAVLFFKIQQADYTRKTAFPMYLVTMLVAYTGFYFFLNGLLRYDTYKKQLLQIIQEQPEKVPWIYYRKQEQHPFGIHIFNFCTLHFKFIDYQNMALYLSEDQCNQLMDLLKLRLPQTTFGYSVQNAQLYEINPDLLLINEK